MAQSPYVRRFDDRKLPRPRGSPPPLTRLDLELTERCNNNCLHCSINLPADDAQAMARELSSEEIQAILQEAAALGCLTVRFTGGEPLLRPDFEALYLFARRLGLKTVIFTNATLLHRHLADRFARIPPLEPIEITLYGMHRESYEAVTRNPGSFRAAWRGINLLLERKIPFIVKGTLLPPNRGEKDELERWAARLPWMDGPPPLAMSFDFRTRRDNGKNSLIQSLRLPPHEILKELTRKPDLYRSEMKKFCERFLYPPGRKTFSCGAGRGSGAVDAYGLFQLCMQVRHPETVYDLRRGSLKEAWQSFAPAIRNREATDPLYLARCANCFLKALCEQCPGKAWAEHGTLDTPSEYFCAIGHAQARYLGLLQEGEHGWEVRNWRRRVRKFCRNGRPTLKPEE